MQDPNDAHCTGDDPLPSWIPEAAGSPWCAMKTVKGKDSLFHAIHLGLVQLMKAPYSSAELRGFLLEKPHPAWKATSDYARLETDKVLEQQYDMDENFPGDAYAVDMLAELLTVNIIVIAKGFKHCYLWTRTGQSNVRWNIVIIREDAPHANYPSYRPLAKKAPMGYYVAFKTETLPPFVTNLSAASHAHLNK